LTTGAQVFSQTYGEKREFCAFVNTAETTAEAAFAFLNAVARYIVPPGPQIAAVLIAMTSDTTCTELYPFVFAIPKQARDKFSL
jgi:hypothetical protein